MIHVSRAAGALSLTSQPIVQKTLGNSTLTLWASTACYRDSVTFCLHCDLLPKAGILKSEYTAIASQQLRQTRSRRNGEVGY
jgi:hypothetical protein